MVIGVRDHHQFVVAPRYDVHPCMRYRTFDQRDVHARLEEHSEHGAGVGARRLNSYPGMPKMEAPEHGREHIGGDRGARADPEDAALEAAELSQFPFSDPLDAEELTGAGVEGASGIGEADIATRAVDEGEIELSLQLLEGFGDSRLAEVQRRGGLGESAVVSDGGEEA